jgi:putative ABC transport system permease protein
MSTLINDIKYAFRMLIKKPGFTVIAVLTLALGIGSNIAIFSFVNTYLLRPFPYEDAECLVDFTGTHATFGRMSIAYSNYLNWQRENRTFEELACYRGGSYNLTGVDIPERLRNMQVSSNFLSMLGVSPVLGRFFEQADDQAEAEPTVIISQGFWQRRFEGKSEAIGKSLILDGNAYTIIGVLPSSFNFPPIVGEPIDVLTPIGLMARYEWFMGRSNHTGIGGIGKLREEVTLSQARDDLNRVAGQLEEAYPDTNAGCRVVVSGFHEQITGDIRPALLVLMCAVAFVLMIVCVNIANLLLVRSTDRIQEFSVRSALGAGRLRIIRQLLCENLILVILGGAFGIVVAKWGYNILYAQLPDVVRQNTETLFRVDVSLTLFTLAITLGSGLVFGLFPAWRSSKVNISTTMRNSTRTASAGLSHSRLRDILVVSEIALALVLLVGAGLMLRSFIHYMQADPGYNPDSTLTARIDLSDSRYPNDEQKYNFYKKFLEQIKSMPSVRHASVARNMLGGWQSGYYVEGAPIPERGQNPFAEWNIVSPDFCKAMGIRLLEGRFFTEKDSKDSQSVVVVDEKFAHKWWPDESPIGKRLQQRPVPDPNDRWYEVVGVVSHIKHYGVDRDSRESMYLSAYQNSFNGLTLVVRTQGDPMRLVTPIQKAVLQLDPDLPVSNIQTLKAIVAEQSLIRRLTTQVLGLFALSALLLSVLGIYGVIAYSVSKRTNEIGIRMAMGASVVNILRMVLTHGGKLILIGTGIGLVGAFAVTRLMSSFLFEVTARDPITFLLVTAVLTCATLLACYVPARRATRIDPMEALRYE